MNSEERARILVEFNPNPPASEKAIDQVELERGAPLPEDYVLFLRETNGGEGFVGPNAYIILWRAEELAKWNQAYEVSTYAPGLFLFGSDGGGEAFAFDMRTEKRPVVSVPFVGMELSVVTQMAPRFEEFLEELSRL